MKSRELGDIGSDELWEDFRRTQPVERVVKCWVCREMLEVEFLELECPTTGAVEIVKVDFCPKCGNRLR